MVEEKVSAWPYIAVSIASFFIIAGSMFFSLGWFWQRRNHRQDREYLRDKFDNDMRMVKQVLTKEKTTLKRKNQELLDVLRAFQYRASNGDLPPEVSNLFYINIRALLFLFRNLI